MEQMHYEKIRGGGFFQPFPGTYWEDKITLLIASGRAPRAHKHLCNVNSPFIIYVYERLMFSLECQLK